MAILLKDLEAEKPISGTSLTTLRNQVDRCKKILGSISAAAGEIRAESGSPVQLDSYIHHLVESWKNARPEVNAQLTLDNAGTAPCIVADQTLDQALLNILNNAADASPDSVEIKIHWNTDELVLDVSDRGKGVAPDIESRAGDTIHSTKQDGLGLGLFLTFSTLERLGGTVSLFNRDSGGATCRVSLPLSAILIPEYNDKQ